MEDTLDHPVHSADAMDHLGQVLAALGIELAGVVALDPPGQRRHAAQGGLEVVRDDGCEVLQFAVGGLQLPLPGAEGLVGLLQFPRAEHDFGLRPLALGNVAEDDAEEPVAAHLDLGDGGFHWEFLAVGPQAAQGIQPAHPAIGPAGLSEVPHVPCVRLPETLRDEPIERTAKGLGGRTAEHDFGGGVEQHDPLPVVHGDDRIHRRRDNSR